MSAALSEQVPAALRRALTLHQEGRLDEARRVYQHVLHLDPGNAVALNLLGMISVVTNDPATALGLFAEALRRDPGNAGVHVNRGLAFARLKQWDAALASYERALALEPDCVAALCNRGALLARLKRWQEALGSYDRAIALTPDSAEALANRGLVLAELRQWQAALASCERAIALKPDFAEAHANRGLALAAFKQWEAALSSYERAIALKPDHTEAHVNRGIVLARLNQWTAALASYERAIALKPDHAEALSNRGIALTQLRQFDAALVSHDRAVAARPDLAEARFNRSILRLLLGDHAQGWQDYEWRHQERRDFPQPRWSGGESLEGRTILLYAEQGLGDTLQFCRYAAEVARLGAEVILEVQAPLTDVLSGLPGVSRLLARGDPLPRFDYCCPLPSLPRAFKTDLESIPRPGRYLAGDAGKVGQWNARLGAQHSPRIGLAWSGSPAHKNDHQRSILLADLVRYLPENFQYFVLQKDLREADRSALQSHPHILVLPDAIADFAGTAALCECLDLVISVDTSVAHLSAALGKRTWVLLPFIPDWRWRLDRCDSPWYSSVTLYRQEAPADWSGVLERLREDLISPRTQWAFT